MKRNFLNNKYLNEDRKKFSNCLQMQGIKVSEEFEKFFEILIKSENELKVNDLIENDWLKEAIDNKLEIEENLKIDFKKKYNIILNFQELDKYTIDLTNTLDLKNNQINHNNLLVDSFKNQIEKIEAPRIFDEEKIEKKMNKFLYELKMMENMNNEELILNLESEESKKNKINQPYISNFNELNSIIKRLNSIKEKENIISENLKEESNIKKEMMDSKGNEKIKKKIESEIVSHNKFMNDLEKRN